MTKEEKRKELRARLEPEISWTLGRDSRQFSCVTGTLGKLVPESYPLWSSGPCFAKEAIIVRLMRQAFVLEGCDFEETP